MKNSVESMIRSFGSYAQLHSQKLLDSVLWDSPFGCVALGKEPLVYGALPELFCSVVWPSPSHA